MSSKEGEEKDEKYSKQDLYNDIDTRAQKIVEEAQDKLRKESLRDRPYAVCDLCHRILTKAQYAAPTCEWCNGTKATIIKWDILTESSTTTV